MRGGRPRGPQHRVPPGESGRGQKVVIRHRLASGSEVKVIINMCISNVRNYLRCIGVDELLDWEDPDL